MPVDQPVAIEEPTAKEFLQRSHIRTMRKDIKTLKEAGAVPQKIKTPVEEKPKMPAVNMGVKGEKEKAFDIAQKMAAEAEKNKKNTQDMQKKADALKPFPHKEPSAQLQQEKQGQIKAQPKDDVTEAEKQQILLLESQKKDLENQLRAIGEKAEDQFKSKIAQIDNSLKKIYSDIEERKKGVLSGQENVAATKAQPQIPVEHTIESVKEAVAPVKEKVTQPVNVEEAQRKKFMEEVEEWAKILQTKKEEVNQ